MKSSVFIAIAALTLVLTQGQANASNVKAQCTVDVSVLHPLADFTKYQKTFQITYDWGATRVALNGGVFLEIVADDTSPHGVQSLYITSRMWRELAPKQGPKGPYVPWRLLADSDFESPVATPARQDLDNGELTEMVYNVTHQGTPISRQKAVDQGFLPNETISNITLSCTRVK